MIRIQDKIENDRMPELIESNWIKNVNIILYKLLYILTVFLVY